MTRKNLLETEKRAVSNALIRPSQRVSNLFQSFAQNGRISTEEKTIVPEIRQESRRKSSTNVPEVRQEQRRKSSTVNDNRKLLTKSSKDLQRQTSTLSNVEMLFNNEIHASLKKIDEIFKEIREILKEREVELYVELDRVKADGLTLIHRRQQRAVDLRQQLDRCDRLDTEEIEILRSNIKQFVTDRRYEFGEDLRTSHRFEFDRKLVENLKTFGHVSSVNRNSIES